MSPRADQLSTITAGTGVKPPVPADVKTTLWNGKLSISVSGGSRSIIFVVTFNLPSGSGVGPFPAMIAYGGLSLPVSPV